MRLAHADVRTGSSSERVRSCTRSMASKTVIIFVIDAGGQRRWASCSASTVPLSASITRYAAGAAATSGWWVLASAADAMSAPHAATAAALRVALIPNYLGAASRRHSPSASECDERFVAPDELLRIGADHVSAPVELAVHQQPPD